jgi:Leucine-rich repeat (LRR) protein
MSDESPSSMKISSETAKISEDNLDIADTGNTISISNPKNDGAAVNDISPEQLCGECLPPPPPALVSRKQSHEAMIVLPMDVFEMDSVGSPHGSNDAEVLSLVIIGTTRGREYKVTKIAGMENNPKVQNLRELVLRSCLISRLEGVKHLAPTLTKLELYDNQIEDIDVDCITALRNLRILDLSFNALRSMDFLKECDFPFLEELYIAQNKLRKIEGLESVPSLRILDLGANRIRVRKYLNTLFPSKMVSFLCLRYLD